MLYKYLFNMIEDKKNQSPQSISRLSPEIINQISAGEVVQRPANMIKELIENSLDAKASKIEIQFSEGGRFVQVKDNGLGIPAQDLLLALSPHSTSKIKSLSDIWSIGSYGFRGEALASIAEVSNLSLISKTKTSDKAGRLNSYFGKKSSLDFVSAEQGTKVIVKDLFQKTPARLKFLKSQATETRAIQQTIKAMALCQPQVEFRVLHNGKLLFYWPGVKDLKHRVQQILALKNPFYIKTKYKDIYVEAAFSAPNQTHNHRRQMWLFVESRHVEDTTLYSAIMTAYRGLLMHGEYPILALNIRCPKQDLDVNVHPAKSKVRFKNSSAVFTAVQRSLRAVLETGPWIQHQKTAKPFEENQAFKGMGGVLQKTHFQNKNPYKANYFGPQNGLQNSLKTLDPLGTADTNPPLPNSEVGEAKGLPPQTSSSKAENAGSLVTEQQTNKTKGPIVNYEPATQDTVSKTPGQGEEVQKNYWSSLYVLGQAHLTYILAQSREAIVFIDQHAAHERVLYEKFFKLWNTGQGNIQKRLVPLALDLDESLVKALLTQKNALLKLGLEIERSGPDGLLVHSAPAILKDMALQKSLVQLGQEIRDLGDNFALDKKISDLCASLACHSAVRAGQALSYKEIRELLVLMDEFPLSSFCPHGRPVFVNYPITRLEKDFCRKL